MSGPYVPRSGPVLASLRVPLYPGVPVRVSLHPVEDRVVVGIGASTGAAFLDLFVQRGELVALRDALAAAVTDLDATQPDTAQHDAAQHDTAQHDTADNTTNDDETTGDRDETAPVVEVRAPAA